MNWHEFNIDQAEEVFGNIIQRFTKSNYAAFPASLSDQATDLEAAIDMYHRFADLDLDDILAN
jgi:hypothetical protein